MIKIVNSLLDIVHLKSETLKPFSIVPLGYRVLECSALLSELNTKVFLAAIFADIGYMTRFRNNNKTVIVWSMAIGKTALYLILQTVIANHLF